jgi:sporulation protein YlmC with PRC-barrel domain
MVVFIDSSCIVAYCRGTRDDFNTGAVALYVKLNRHRGIITKLVKNQTTYRLNELMQKAKSQHDIKYAHSIVFKRGKFLGRVEELEINNKSKERRRIKEIQQALKGIEIKKKEEIMHIKGRGSFLPESSDIIIGAQATVLKEELGESPFYLASTDQDFTFLMAGILENYDVYVDFPGSIASRL